MPLENPGELVSEPGKTARFGTPIRLDLGGRGIRSIEYWKDRDLYLIVGGPIGTPDSKEKKPFKLYQWSGKSTPGPQEIASADLTGLNPEAIVIYPGIKDRFQVLSDDGDVGGCKGLADDDPNKRFRSRWIDFP